MGATGGTITYSEDYTIHTFNSSGDFVSDEELVVDVLRVAGGGGGGHDYGGGGGAGGIVFSVGLTLAAGTYPAVAGDGGAGGTTGAGSSGSDSSFNGLSALGGGGGGGGDGTPAGSGGSGGGGSFASGSGVPVLLAKAMLEATARTIRSI